MHLIGKCSMPIACAILMCAVAGCASLPLENAIRLDQTEQALVLINRGQGLTETDNSNQTPLHWAALRDNAEITKGLISKGAFVDSRDRWGQTPLMLAAAHGHL